MSKLRSHITKLFIVSLIGAGFALYIVQPVKAKSSSRSFTNWLTSVVQKGNTPKLLEELNTLKGSRENISGLIAHASQIISRSDEDFNLPLKKEAASHQIYQILLVEWNQFQTGNGMANVPPPQTVKPAVNLQVDKLGPAGHGKIQHIASPKCLYEETEVIVSNHIIVSRLMPMVGGRAIGAP